MRLIDADKLCVDLMERWDIADKQKEELIRQVMADIVTPIVVSQPTVQPERKKGKWIDICGNLRCSECNIEYPDLYPDYDETNFCPNCGAEMSIQYDDYETMTYPQVPGITPTVI